MFLEYIVPCIPGEVCSTDSPTDSPTNYPSSDPSGSPSSKPSRSPSSKPSRSPSSKPSTSPSSNPSISPSGTPSSSPSTSPSLTPTTNPTISTGTPVDCTTQSDLILEEATGNYKEFPYAEGVVQIREQNIDDVIFSVSQLWKEEGVPMFAVNYRSSSSGSGDDTCEMQTTNDGTLILFNSTEIYTAQCIMGYAEIAVYVYVGPDDDFDIEECEACAAPDNNYGTLRPTFSFVRLVFYTHYYFLFSNSFSFLLLAFSFFYQSLFPKLGIIWQFPVLPCVRSKHRNAWLSLLSFWQISNIKKVVCTTKHQLPLERPE